MSELDAARLLVATAIAITVAEAIFLVVRSRPADETAPARAAAVANAFAGLSLQVTLLAVLGGGGLAAVALGLVAAGACHAIDLASRRRERRRKRRDDVV